MAKNKLNMKNKKTKKKKSKKRTKRYNSNIIDVPISDNISRGSKASLGHIDYHYQKYYNTFSFIEKMIEKNKKLKRLVCIPNIGKGELKSFLKIIFLRGITKSNQSINPVDSGNSLSEFVVEIKKCMNHRLIPINLGIIIPDIGTHANIIIIDTKKKTVELFEPHGSRGNDSELESVSRAYYKVSKNVERFFKQYFMEYTFIPPPQYEPNEGLQVTIDAYSGLCVTWSILYLHYRILNPDVSQKRLIKYLDRRITRNFILRYMKYIEDILKGKL